jgi:magnesium transporter
MSEPLHPSLETLIREKNIQSIRERFDLVPIVDLAEEVNNLEDPKDILFVFKTCSNDVTAELFSYLPSSTQERLLQLFTDKQIVDLLNHSYSDDVADFLGELPANLVQQILKNVDVSYRDEINQLLRYKEATAGSIMTPEYITLSKDATVDDALTKIRKIGREKETIQSLFVIDSKRYLIGILSLEDLVYHAGETHLFTLMSDDFQTCHVHTHQDEVAKLFKRYNLTVLPVLNESDRLVGIITIDDVLHVIEDIASEDILKMAAINPLEDDYKATSSWMITKKSIPWILGLMMIGSISTFAINQFESTFQSVIILTAFIPMIMNTGGNAGNQSIALITRALATHELSLKDIVYIIKKEIMTAVIMSFSTAIFAFLWITLLLTTQFIRFETFATPYSLAWFSSVAQVGGLVASTLLLSVFVAKLLGSLLPLLAIKIKKDPAIMSSPFLTTIMDFTSLIIYFIFANYLFNFF